MLMPELPQKWAYIVSKVEHAFQPITNPFNGATFAVEALLRNYDQVGFGSIDELLEAVYREKILFSLDLQLRSKAIKKFTEINFYKQIKLIYNYDPRLLEMEDFRFEITDILLKENGLSNDVICFE